MRSIASSISPNRERGFRSLKDTDPVPLKRLPQCRAHDRFRQKIDRLTEDVAQLPLHAGQSEQVRFCRRVEFGGKVNVAVCRCFPACNRAEQAEMPNARLPQIGEMRLKRGDNVGGLGHSRSLSGFSAPRHP